MLFRQQAVDAQRVRLYGSVLIVTPVSFWIITAFLTAIATALVVFLVVGSFARIETVQGSVTPSAGLVRVTAPGQGVLTSLNVIEGQKVQQGDILGRIVSTNSAAGEGTRTGARLKGLTQRIALLDQRQRQAEIVAELELRAKAQEATEINTQLAELNAMQDFQAEILAEAEGAWERTERLQKRNLVNADAVSAQRVELISTRREAVRMASEIDKLLLRRDSLTFDRERQSASHALQMLEFEAERESLLAEREVILRQDAFDIVAPTSGVVTGTLVSENFEVQPSTQLFAILPENSTLQVELYVPSRAIGFVEPGQSVSLLFDAFPYQKFGSQPGTIAEVTTSAISPSADPTMTQVEEPVYRVKVTLERDTVMAFGREMAIQPGMRLAANIILEDRSALDWLLEPLISVAARAG